MALLPSDPKQQKLLLLGMIPLVAAFAYGYFLHPAKKDEIALMERRLERLEDLNRRAQVISRESGAELENVLARYEAHMERLEQLIPKTEEVSGLLYTMALRALETDVDLVTLEPEAAVPNEHYSRQSYRISVAGGYHNIGRFLSEVGSLPRIVTPVDLEMTEFRGPTRRDNLEEEYRRLQARFRIQTYILPADPAMEGSNGTRP